MSTKKNHAFEAYEAERNHPRFHRVVLIDDKEMNLFIQEAIILSAAFTEEIYWETQPFRFLEKLGRVDKLQDVPEILFLNIDMKEFDTLEFLEKFDQLSDFVRNKCKIVMVSGSVKKIEEFNKLRHPGIIRFLLKPMDVVHVREFIQISEDLNIMSK